MPVWASHAARRRKRSNRAVLLSPVPVEVSDLFQTLCQALRIDASTELYTPQGRPLTIVDGGAPVNELFA